MPDISESKYREYIEPFPRERASALPVMQELQRELGCVPDEAVEDLAEYVGASAAELFGLVTFYKSLVRTADEQPAEKGEQFPPIVRVGDELQRRIVLEGIDPDVTLSLADYQAQGGYKGLERALELGSDAVVAEVEASKIRGKGGAGYPTGKKWRAALHAQADAKYFICNGTEGDPQTFVDGPIMMGNPHRVLEGLAIGALAIGAETAYFYIRSDYTRAIAAVQAAIDEAYAAGVLGEDVLGSGKKLEVSIVAGGGSFVCGESTALMTAMEGGLPEPHAKYDHATDHGLNGLPTVLNNVETLAAIPFILREGGEAFAAIGTESSTGTKAFSLSGSVKNPGLIEVPFGTTLRQVVYEIGGGTIDDRPFKALLLGGPSENCIAEDKLDLPIDFEAMRENDAMLGSGGLIVLDESDCIVDTVLRLAEFLSRESCGKCTPCREGMRQIHAILARIANGEGREGDLELLELIGRTMRDASLCALGKAAPNPILSTVDAFREEYEAHINDGICPAGANISAGLLSRGGAE